MCTLAQKREKKEGSLPTIHDKFASLKILGAAVFPRKNGMEKQGDGTADNQFKWTKDVIDWKKAWRFSGRAHCRAPPTTSPLSVVKEEVVLYIKVSRSRVRLTFQRLIWRHSWWCYWDAASIDSCSLKITTLNEIKINQHILTCRFQTVASMPGWHHSIYFQWVCSPKCKIKNSRLFQKHCIVKCYQTLHRLRRRPY